MAARQILSVNFNHQRPLKNVALYSTNSMWRKNNQVNFRAKIAAPICAAPTYYTSIWGDHFLQYRSSDPLLAKDDMIRHEKLKEEVRGMLTGCTEVPEIIEMIDALERLGVDYHFRSEIDQILESTMEKTKQYLDGDGGDLHTISLIFRVLRQQRYDISCDAFNKFKDSNGKFKDDIVKDARGMLSLYEATHLRTLGEDILDEALSFTTQHLKAMATKLDSPISQQINNALSQPYYMGIPRLETWKYLQCYEVKDSRDETLLSFAELDFNLLKKLHQMEVGELTKWRTELDLGKMLPLIRDRLVECYFWALAIYFEPEFSSARILITKVYLIASIIDDVLDEVASFEEVQLFAEALERWDLGEMKQLPDIMKGIYKATIDLFSEIEDIMEKQGKSYRSYYSKESMRKFVRGTRIQVNWLHRRHMPTMDEYLHFIVPSVAWDLFAFSTLIFMDDIVTKQICAWSLSEPRIVVVSTQMIRYLDDIVDLKMGHKSRNNVTSIDCYMNENNCTEEEAIEELQKRIIYLNKEINGELLQLKSIPMPVITRLLNLNRILYTLYVDKDNYTHAEGAMKDYITALLVDPYQREIDRDGARGRLTPAVPTHPLVEFHIRRN